MKKKSKFKSLQKDMKAFMKDEEGFTDKDTILKIGLGTVSALGVIAALSHNVFSAIHTSHFSINTMNEVHAGACYRYEASHVNHSVHTSHTNHGSY